MTVWDGIRMAMHNLWSRKGRTFLNLLGIVISCIMLTMTLAGTRGAREGVFDIMNASAETKRFMIFRSYNRNAEVPAEAIQVPDGLSDRRRARMVERLEEAWRRKNARLINMNQEVMAQLRAVENMDAVVWQSPLRCQFVWQDEQPVARDTEESDDNDKRDDQDKRDDNGTSDTRASKPVPGSLIGIDPTDSRIVDRLVVGQTADTDDGVLIDEFTAYNMGYKTDAELQTVVGKRVQLRCVLGRVAKPSASTSTSNRIDGMLGAFAGLVDADLIDALTRVAQQIDKTDLSDEEKKSIRKAFNLKAPSARQANQPAAQDSADDEEDADLDKVDLPPDVEVDSQGNKVLVREAVVRGVLRQPEDEDLLGFLQFAGRGSIANIYINHLTTEQIQARKDGFTAFYNVAGSVAEVDHLRNVVKDVEAIGLKTRSAVGMVKKLEQEVGKVKLAVGALALLILVVAAIGICNTMIIAVLERTPEFGIMKALGASDKQVLLLVLMEGLVTGLIGAAIAILISFGVAELISEVARTWIEEKLRGSFDQPVFRFHVIDAAIVFAVSSFICMLACFIPAWRAAKLDPVAAMKRA